MVIAPSAASLAAGLLLLRRAPVLPYRPGRSLYGAPLSIVIPARDEERNLPAILSSLKMEHASPEVIVVDDESSDETADVARRSGAKVLASRSLPTGWRGKCWACSQGAQAAAHETLLFLDADTCFVAGGLQRLARCFAELPDGAAISVLPFHRMKEWYEQLSLFFNLLMAMGAGGFGGVDRPHMFGQCMMLSRKLYNDAGGHAAVRAETLENMQFADHVRRSGGTIHTFAGAGTLEMRMFPEGMGQLHASWKKGFAQGARASSLQVLTLAYLYLAGCAYAAICLCTADGEARVVAGAVYLAYAALLAFQSRQLGSYRWMTALFYPVPLIFYFAVFGEATMLRLRGRKVSWRGREV